MRLDELKWEPGNTYARVIRKDGKVVEVWKGDDEKTLHIYLDQTSGGTGIDYWENLDPLAAQAVLLELLK
jgi:hypothetical protein